LQEFVYGGVIRLMPDASASTDKQWADYVFNRAGEPGVHQEWWYHAASGTWFIAERDHLKDEILRTYLYNPADAKAGTGHTGLAASQADGNAAPGTDATGGQGGAEQV
jgi:sarcosine oxidase subunit delta